ncbi:Hypothetical protein CINCED_3A000570 [Cinara cedri]|uniref:Uncharacterized protein n=1 Tax=Cinara cedri TaxID=506608 RepID=A0A5E4M706_9HEMI|nr:Hypothetical protein CINCED_3A000570 [Cinara cedri]
MRFRTCARENSPRTAAHNPFRDAYPGRGPRRPCRRQNPCPDAVGRGFPDRGASVSNKPYAPKQISHNNSVSLTTISSSVKRACVQIQIRHAAYERPTRRAYPTAQGKYSRFARYGQLRDDSNTKSVGEFNCNVAVI